MAQLKGFDDFDANAKIGDWAFLNDDTYIAIRLGQGEMDMCILPIAKPGERHAKQNPWTWNGNKEAPTLSPSILHWANGRNQPASWPGYLRDGKLVTA